MDWSELLADVRKKGCIAYPMKVLRDADPIDRSVSSKRRATTARVCDIVERLDRERIGWSARKKPTQNDIVILFDKGPKNRPSDVQHLLNFAKALLDGTGSFFHVDFGDGIPNQTPCTAFAKAAQYYVRGH